MMFVLTSDVGLALWPFNITPFLECLIVFTKDGFLKSEALKCGYCQTCHIIDKVYYLYHKDGSYYFEEWIENEMKKTEPVSLTDGRKRMKYLNRVGYEIRHFKK